MSGFERRIKRELDQGFAREEGGARAAAHAERVQQQRVEQEIRLLVPRVLEALERDCAPATAIRRRRTFTGRWKVEYAGWPIHRYEEWVRDGYIGRTVYLLPSGKFITDRGDSQPCRATGGRDALAGLKRLLAEHAVTKDSTNPRSLAKERLPDSDTPRVTDADRTVAAREADEEAGRRAEANAARASFLARLDETGTPGSAVLATLERAGFPDGETIRVISVDTDAERLLVDRAGWPVYTGTYRCGTTPKTFPRRNEHSEDVVEGGGPNYRGVTVWLLGDGTFAVSGNGPRGQTGRNELAGRPVEARVVDVREFLTFVYDSGNSSEHGFAHECLGALRNWSRWAREGRLGEPPGAFRAPPKAV